MSADIATDPKAFRQAQMFAQTIVHLTSLLHAVALQHLRGDWQLDNLVPYHVLDAPPPLVSKLQLQHASPAATLQRGCLH